LTFSFQFRLTVLVKKFWKLLCSFILWMRDFIKEFSKTMKHFLKKYRHLKSNIPHKFHCLLFIYFCMFFNIFDIFFSYFTYPNLSKNSKHFCGALLYRLYILPEN